MHKHYTSSSCLKVVYSGNAMQWTNCCTVTSIDKFTTLSTGKRFIEQKVILIVWKTGGKVCVVEKIIYLEYNYFCNGFTFYADTCKIHLMHMHASIPLMSFESHLPEYLFLIMLQCCVVCFLQKNVSVYSKGHGKKWWWAVSTNISTFCNQKRFVRT